MTAAVAVIIRHEKDAVAAFQAAGALAPERAITPAAVGIGDHIALRRLQQRAVLRPGTAPGTLYLDVPSWVALRGIRRRVAIVMLVVVLGLGIASWFFTVRAAGR